MLEGVRVPLLQLGDPTEIEGSLRMKRIDRQASLEGRDRTRVVAFRRQHHPIVVVALREIGIELLQRSIGRFRLLPLPAARREGDQVELDLLEAWIDRERPLMRLDRPRQISRRFQLDAALQVGRGTPIERLNGLDNRIFQHGTNQLMDLREPGVLGGLLPLVESSIAGRQRVVSRPEERGEPDRLFEGGHRRGVRPLGRQHSTQPVHDQCLALLFARQGFIKGTALGAGSRRHQ